MRNEHTPTISPVSLGMLQGLISIYRAGIRRTRYDGKHLYWISVDDLEILLDAADAHWDERVAREAEEQRGL